MALQIKPVHTPIKVKVVNGGNLLIKSPVGILRGKKIEK